MSDECCIRLNNGQYLLNTNQESQNLRTNIILIHDLFIFVIDWDQTVDEWINISSYILPLTRIRTMHFFRFKIDLCKNYPTKTNCIDATIFA